MRLVMAFSALALLAVAAACKEGGTITVHSLSFKGVQAINEGRLRDALATHQSSKIPWSKKSYFDRTRFDADLKRIQAFYADRGFPDARVTGFDVKLNDKQDEVDLTVTIVEGAPVVVKALDFSGFEGIPAGHLDDLKKRVPLKVGQPRDRQLVVSTHEMAVNELKDHGFPYAKVTTGEDDGSNGKEAVLTFTAEPGVLAHFGKIEVVGNKSVDEHIIRRQLTFKPGALYQRNLVQDSQRRLYGLELFQFANVETLNPEQQSGATKPSDSGQQSDSSQPPDSVVPPDEVPVRVTVAEGKVAVVQGGQAPLLEHDVDLRVATALEKDEGVEIALNAPAIPLRKEKVDALTELAWASGQLSLQQETVAEAVREFNRRNRLQIVIEDAGVADLHLCCIFDASDPETFARTIVGASEDVELVRTGDTLRIVSRRAGSAEPPAPGKPF